MTTMSAPLWAGFVGMAGPSAVLGGRYVSRRDMQTGLSLAVLLVAALAYMAMARGAVTLVAGRHADWLVTTPLLIADLGIAAGAPAADIALAVVADMLMITAGYLALTAPDSAGMFWAAGMVFFAPVLGLMWQWSGMIEKSKKPAVQLTMALWAVYPALFFAPDSVATRWAYSGLDVASKAVVGMILSA